MITVRLYRTEDYPLVRSWWAARNLPPVHADLLPPLGAMAEQDGRPLAVVWAYRDRDTPVAMLGWAVTAPDNAPRVSAAALDRTVDALLRILQNDGFRMIFAMYGVPALARLLAKHGFVSGDPDARQQVKISGGLAHG